MHAYFSESYTASGHPRKTTSLFSAGCLWVLGGQHGVLATDILRQLCKMTDPPEWMCFYDVSVVKFATSVEDRRKLAGQHNRAQHSGRETTIAGVMKIFNLTIASDPKCIKSLKDILFDTVQSAGMGAKKGSAVCCLYSLMQPHYRGCAHSAIVLQL